MQFDSEQIAKFEQFLECPICMSVVCEPISIACGHTFCRVCLVASLKKHKKRCPTCRSVCHVSAESAEENIMLKNIASTLFSSIYEQRLIECTEEKKLWASTLPIFYYNDVPFPGFNLDLNLFEPRYKHMMQRIVNSTRKFAYVPNFSNYTAKVGDIALVANLVDVQFLPDGCVLIRAKLAERKKIIEHYVEDGTQNLHFCSVEAVHDAKIEPTEVDKIARVLQLVKICHSILNGVLADQKREIEHENGTVPNTEQFSNIELFSLWMASCSPMTSRTKYRLLSSMDTMDRLEMIINSFIKRYGKKRILKDNVIELPAYNESEPSGGRSGRGGGSDGINFTLEDLIQMMPPGLFNSIRSSTTTNQRGAGGGIPPGMNFQQHNIGGFNVMAGMMGVDMTAGDRDERTGNRNRRTAATASNNAPTGRRTVRARRDTTASAAGRAAAAAGRAAAASANSNRDDNDSIPPLAADSDSSDDENDSDPDNEHRAIGRQGIGRAAVDSDEESLPELMVGASDDDENEDRDEFIEDDDDDDEEQEDEDYEDDDEDDYWVEEDDDDMPDMISMNDPDHSNEMEDVD